VVRPILIYPTYSSRHTSYNHDFTPKAMPRAAPIIIRKGR
jgi:hypothetical protein